jgi:REP-associated tyrosine transposase
VFPTLVGAIAAQRRRAKSFRIVHFSVQYDHLHLIVEARNKAALSSGVRALVITLARRVNKLLSQSGRFWADRYHGRALTTPRAVRTALRYVLANFRKHEPRTSPSLLTDPYSSAPWFDGFRECRAGPLLERARFAISWRRFVVLDSPVSSGQTWLTVVGWRRTGLISTREAPSSVERAGSK